MSTGSNRLNRYKYPGAKRLMLEAQELRETTEDYCAQPIDDNLFEWHFTVRGPPETAFDGGYYHGSLSFPTEYPMKPPSIVMFTPNGRFQTNKKICLSISGYHPETWQPSWSVRTALVALIAFMPTKANRAIGSLDFTDVERKKLAIKSRTWRCETCGLIKDLLAQPQDTNKEDSIESVSSSEAGTSRVNERAEEDKKQKQQNNSIDPLDKRLDGQQSSSGNEKEEASDNLSDSQRAEWDSIDNNPRSTGNTKTADSNLTSSEIDDLRNVSRATSRSSSRSRNFSPITSMEQQINVESQSNSISTQNLILRTQNQPEGRRAYQTLVLKSIFTLLLLLILRRVVMVMQA